MLRSQFQAPLLISCVGSGTQAGVVTLPPVPLVVVPPWPVLLPPACPVLPAEPDPGLPPAPVSSAEGLAQPQNSRLATAIGLISWRIETSKTKGDRTA